MAWLALFLPIHIILTIGIFDFFGTFEKKKKWWILANFDFQGEESWLEKGRVCAFRANKSEQ